jgi:hypothetical protein
MSKKILVIPYSINSSECLFSDNQLNIQVVPGGKVNILGGHSIGHFKQKQLYIYMCPIPNGFWDRAISLYSSYRPHKGTSRCTQTSTTPCLLTSFKVHWCWRWDWRKNIMLGKLYHHFHVNNKFHIRNSEIALSRKPFGIWRMYILQFFRRMTANMTSQNTDLSFWDTLYTKQIGRKAYRQREYDSQNFDNFVCENTVSQAVSPTEFHLHYQRVFD